MVEKVGHTSFLSTKMGVNIPRMRSAQGDQHAMVSCHSNLGAANFVNISLNIYFSKLLQSFAVLKKI